MADADLRRLQRAWEAAPDDVAIASEYIRELERASYSVSEDTGRIRDFEVGYAPSIELDIGDSQSGNEQDRLLWRRLVHFAKFMTLPEDYFEGYPRAWMWDVRINRLFVPTSEEVIRNIVGPEREGPRYQNWHRVRQDIEEARARGYRYVVIHRIAPTKHEGMDVRLRQAERRYYISGDPTDLEQYQQLQQQAGLSPLDQRRRNPKPPSPEAEEIKQDFILAARTWPISQLREYLFRFFIPQVPPNSITRHRAKHLLITATEIYPIADLQEVHHQGWLMAIGGIINWEIKNGPERIEAGENPFQILSQVLNQYPDYITNFDDLDDLRRSMEEN